MTEIMTKQEKIREGIAERIFEWYQKQFNLHPWKWSEVKYGGLRGLILGLTDTVLEYEASQGAVLKVERELPHNPYPNSLHLSADNKYMAYHRSQRDMIKDNFSAFEPLI